MSLPPVGLQCLVLKEKYDIENEAILDRVADCGYAAVEAAVREPARFKQLLDARGLRYGGMHVVPRRLQQLEPIVATLIALDAHDVCNSGMLEWHQQSAGDFRQAIDILNTAGRRLRDDGIHLHYHNHDFEFNTIEDGKTGMDLLLDGLDPAAVDLCVDVAWVARAGLDPAKFLRTHNARIGYLHFKDFDADGWLELGRGQVDFAAIMDVLPELTSVRWVMVEQDTTRIDPLNSIAHSRQFLKDHFNY